MPAYLAALPAASRAMVERLLGLACDVVPDAAVVMSYGIPTVRSGRRRFHVGAWKHGVSVYGWHDGHDGGFTAAHPDLVHGRSTLRFSEAELAAVGDDELRALAAATLRT